MNSRRSGNRWTALLLALSVAIGSGSVRAQFDGDLKVPGGGEKAERGVKLVDVEFLTSLDAVLPGESMELALRFTIPSGYHIYAPENDFPTRVHLPSVEGITFGDLRTPPGHWSAESQSWEYTESVVYLVEVRAATDAKPGPRKATARIEMQACTPQQCTEFSNQGGDPHSFSIEVAEKGATVKAQNEEIFRSGSEPGLDASIEGGRVAPGERFWITLAVAVPHDHYLSGPAGPGVPFSVDAELPDGWSAGPTIYPSPDEMQIPLPNGERVAILGYPRAMRVALPVTAAAAAKPGEVELALRVRYQSNQDVRVRSHRKEGVRLPVRVTVVERGVVAGPITGRRLGLEILVMETPLKEAGQTWVALRLVPPDGSFLFGDGGPGEKALAVEVLPQEALRTGQLFHLSKEQSITYRLENGVSKTSKGYSGGVEFGLRVSVPDGTGPGRYPIPIRVTYALAEGPAAVEESASGGDVIVAWVAVAEKGSPTSVLDDPIFDRLVEAEKAAGQGQEDYFGAGLIGLLVLAFLTGLASTFNPCVPPMILITLAFFGAQATSGEGKRGVGKTLVLALAFVLGMCATFTALGVVASLAGKAVAGFAQHPVVVIGIATVFVALSLSFFGLYELKPPESLMSRLGAGQARAGLAGAFVMGALLGFIATPCIGAWVAGLMLAVATQAKVLWGAAAFFLYGLGLSSLFVVVAFAGDVFSKIPESAMKRAKAIFGLLFIGSAGIVVDNIVPGDYDWVLFLIWGLLFILGGMFFGGLDRLSPEHGLGLRIAKSMGFVTIALGLVCLARGVDGSGLLRGVRLFGAGGGGGGASLAVSATAGGGPEGSWLTDHDLAIATGRSEKKPVLVDFWAESCGPCKTYQNERFPDSKVAPEMRRFVLVKLDNTLEENARIQREVYGLPSQLPLIVLYDSKGNEVRRVTSLVSVDEFAAILKGVR